MTTMSRISLAVALGSVFFLTLALCAKPAQACGGLFCSAAAPVNQAAERIIFSKNDDGSVTAVVQIQYEGPSEEFAWVLPVPGIPEVNVSSDLAFMRIQQASNPQYTFTTEVEGRCKESRGDNSAWGGWPTAGPRRTGGAGIDVLAEGNVGPYDYTVIRPETSFENVGDVVVEWLTSEGYDVVPPGGDPDEIADLLGSYMLDGMNLLAFRLTKGNSTGTIRPIWITYASDRPMIPIRPTAVAANDDMGVMVWVLGESRAVPVNYKALELNQVLINWLNGARNYNQVVVAAANEAGGQGFVAERAGPSSDYEDVVILPFERDDWEALRTSADALSARELLEESAWRFAAWDGYRGLVEDLLPEGVDVDAFISCPSCNGVVVSDFDKRAFLEDLEEDVIEPMIATQELLDSRPYVTRLYTTLSAPEMDLDPLFDFNPDLSNVSNIHTARRVIECHRSIYQNEAPTRFELEDGNVVRLHQGDPWPFDTTDEEPLPANAKVLTLTTSGPGTVVTDNSQAIDEALSQHNATVASPGCGCGVVSPKAQLGSWASLALFALLRRRRRRPA
jgi:MYXO-CTERM domain-containing protein